MRNMFASEVYKHALERKELVLLSGDIGNNLFNGFRKDVSDRFYNCGVAEANMMSFAAGLALTGFRPFVYTITPFTTFRCMEQIKIDVCYHNLPVTIVGVGAGLSYAGLGATHHSLEDLAMLRSLPNLTVIAPADAIELKNALRFAVDCPGPVYMRIGKKGEPVIHKDQEFDVSRPIKIREGRDLCILSTGHILPLTQKVAETLNGLGISAEVYSVPMVKPLPENDLLALTQKFSNFVTLEEHSIVGGFGSAVSELFSDRAPRQTMLLRYGTPDKFLKGLGEGEHAHSLVGLDAERIAKDILNKVADSSKCESVLKPYIDSFRERHTNYVE